MSKVLKVKVTTPWVSVTERKPEPFEYVLGYYPDSKQHTPKINIIWFNSTGRASLDDSKEDDVFFGAPSAWMKMPNAPEE